MRSVLTGLALALLLGATGCGGSDTDPVQALDCETTSPYDTDEMFVQDAETCALPSGGEVRVYTFADTDARDSWIEIAERFGADTVSGDGAWVVTSDDDKAMETARGILS